MNVQVLFGRIDRLTTLFLTLFCNVDTINIIKYQNYLYFADNNVNILQKIPYEAY